MFTVARLEIGTGVTIEAILRPFSTNSEWFNKITCHWNYAGDFMSSGEFLCALRCFEALKVNVVCSYYIHKPQFQTPLLSSSHHPPPLSARVPGVFSNHSILNRSNRSPNTFSPLFRSSLAEIEHSTPKYANLTIFTNKDM
jgi:hypothetical protein